MYSFTHWRSSWWFSSFRQQCVKVLQTSAGRFLCGHVDNSFGKIAVHGWVNDESMFSFVRNHQMSSKVADNFVFLPVMNSYCSTSLSVFGVVRFPDFGYSNQCVVSSLYCYSLHFPDDVWSRASFHMLICFLYILLGRYLLRFWPIFFF